MDKIEAKVSQAKKWKTCTEGSPTRLSMQPTENKGGFVFKNDREFQVIAQQTTGGDVRQLHFEVTLVLIHN